jgi:hypothetical protein
MMNANAERDVERGDFDFELRIGKASDNIQFTLFFSIE